MKCKTISLVGQKNDSIVEICDEVISIPSFDTPRIQEMHILIGHILCQLIDREYTTK